MTTELIDPQTAESRHPLAPHWIATEKEVRSVVTKRSKFDVWIIKRAKLADSLIRSVRMPEKGMGYLIVLDHVTPEQLTVFSNCFRSVAFSSQAGNNLPKEELFEVLRSADRGDRFIAGFVNEHMKRVILWRGDFSTLVVPFTAFPPTANGIKPKWDSFLITDYGKTLCFGGYESSADAILYEFDEEFRREMNKRRQQEEQSLGASIRRLRKQRRLLRSDFRGLDPKTIARIERGEVEPRSDTLGIIASTLKVPVEELATY